MMLVSAACILLAAVAGSLALAGGPGHAPSSAFADPHAAAPTGNALLQQAEASNFSAHQASLALPAATAPPAPAPPSLADAAPLKSHEVFGFAPYWTLADSSGFNVAGISTLAYFSIGVNADGSLAETGPGWNGYESQALADLITRAHGAGDRVVLAVNCFDQQQLNQLTSSPTAGATLSAALISAIQAKNLDGVNLDFEGQGAGDQAGLTRLVTQVSAAVHAANPHYQVTMDTYASSAGDPNGFYNIPALAPVVDGFFVMAYQLNLAGSPSATSPLTSSMFSDQTTIDQYAAAVPAAKVILGMPYFGYDWPTSDGTLTAQATGPATPISYGQVMAANHPIYWDSVTNTAWTSYQVGTQWHESFFEDATSLFEAAQMASAKNLGGVGIWALGMDGNDASLLNALLGFAPATKAGPAGPATTTTSPPSTSTTTSTSTSTSTTTSTTAPTGDGSTTSTAPPTTTTSTTAPTAHTYSGTWQGVSVAMSLVQGSDIPAADMTTIAGHLSGFTTDDSNVSCLAADPALVVYAVVGVPGEYLVVAQTPTDCADADFTFIAPS